MTGRISRSELGDLPGGERRRTPPIVDEVALGLPPPEKARGRIGTKFAAGQLDHEGSGGEVRDDTFTDPLTASEPEAKVWRLLSRSEIE